MAEPEGSHPCAQKKDLYLEFEDSDGTNAEDSLRYLLIGCCVPPGTEGEFAGGAKDGGNFEITIENTTLFSVTPAKDTCVAGTTKKIAFQYLCPNETSDVATAEDADENGRWIETTAKILLSGGFVPESSPPTQEITVHLKAHLRSA